MLVGIPLALGIWWGLVPFLAILILIVVRLDSDTCAYGTTGTQVIFHATPTEQGAVTLIEVSGTRLRYTTAGGGSGQLDCSTGQFG
jgi:hypothetical protein